MDLSQYGPGGASNGKDPNVEMIKGAMESCAGKTVMSGVMGFGLGGVMGMFMASMSYDTPFGGVPGSPGAQAIQNLPMRQQLKLGFKDMGARSWSSARNFGRIGAIYSGVECGIEGVRAKNDMTNPIAAGCVTGGILARSAGPYAMAGGCATFAAFSAAIEAWMRSPAKDE